MTHEEAGAYVEQWRQVGPEVEKFAVRNCVVFGTKSWRR